MKVLKKVVPFILMLIIGVSFIAPISAGAFDYETSLNKDKTARKEYEDLCKKIGISSSTVGATLKITDDNLKTAKKIYQLLINGGATPTAAAGIIGNMYVESGLSTTASNGTHYGLCQWDISGRWQNVVNYCKKKGLDSNTVEGQVSFILNCSEGMGSVTSICPAGLTWKDLGVTETSDSLKFLKQDFKSAPLAALYWEWVHERCHGSTDKSDMLRLLCATCVWNEVGGSDKKTADTTDDKDKDKDKDDTKAGDKDAKAGVTVNLAGSIMEESEFVKVNKLYDKSIKLPTSQDLDATSKRNLTEWKKTLDAENENKPFSFMRTLVLFIGILITVYSVFLYVAYQFDRNQNFIDISLLRILTFGRLVVSPEEVPTSYSSEVQSKNGQRTVNHKDIIIVTLIGVSIGVFIISGKMYITINAVIEFIKDLISG